MNNIMKFGCLPGAAWLVASCICLCTSPSLFAAGFSAQSKTRSHGQDTGHYNSSTQGAMGNVEINRQSLRYYPHHHSSVNRYPHQSNHRYYSYPRHHSYSSPRQHYYRNGYTQPYLDSRFPESYRNYSNYQQTGPRYYGYSSIHSSNAWESLARGQTRTALSLFSREAQSFPKAGLPVIGYSLSAATSGDLKQGVVAMRRVLRIDPYSLRYYQLDPRLLPIVSNLIVSYKHKLNHRRRRKDEAFMVAALSYIKHDYAGTYQALERAKRDGDSSKSYRFLREFVDHPDLATE